MKLTKFGAKFLCLFLLVSFVPLGIAGTIVYKYVHDKTKENVLSQLRYMSHGLNDQLNLLLARRRDRVVDFSSDGFIRDCVEQMSFRTNDRSYICKKLNSHLVRNKKILYPDILEVAILDSKGTVIASTSQEQMGKDKSHEDYFRNPFLSIEQRGSYFGNNLERTETASELQLVFSTILRDKNFQRPIGVIVTKVKGDILNNVFCQNSHQTDKEGINGSFNEIYIVNSDKAMIANSIASNSINSGQIIDTGIVQETFATKEEFSGIYYNYRGVQVFGTMLFVPETNWVIMAEKNIKEAFAPLARIRNIFLISGGVVLFLVTIFAFVISKDTSNVIKKLIDGFRRIETGDFGHTVTINKRWDERKDLAVSFNTMTKKLKESKELEDKFDKIKMLDSLTEKINSGLTLEEVLNYVYENFRSIIPYNRIGFALLVDDGTTVEAYWARSEAKEVYLTKGFSVKLDESSLSDVIVNEKPRIINDMREYLKIKPQSESTSLMVKEGMLSSLNCPLFALGRPIGFVFFSSFEVNAYSNVHVELFMQIAGELAITVEKSRLYQELENKLDEIKMLESLTEKINSGITLEEVLNYVYESFRAIIPYERIGVAFLVDNGKTVEHKWTRTDAKEIKLDNGYSVKLEETTLSNIVKTTKPRIIPNLKEYLRVQPQSESTKLMVEEGMLSNLTCPLIALGKPIGFMFFSSFKVNAYSNVHVELFRQIAGQLAVIIEKSRLYQQLEELNELKNGFLGMAAHDLRNPNALIRLYLGQLTKSLGDIKGDQHVWISKIHNITDSMLVLINDFLDISTIEAGQLQLKLEPVSPDVFFANCLKVNKALTKEKSNTLKLDLEEGLPMVDIDSDRISQVINNLITNAMKYSIPKTEIILSARRREDVLEVSVIDQGQGIPENDINKLFRMFGTASVRPTAGEKSTGLGLAICKHIVESHGCRIWVESKGIGKGSTFKFTLPLKERRSPRITTASQTELIFSVARNGEMGYKANVLNLSEGGIFADQITAFNIQTGERVNVPETEIVGKELYDLKFELNGNASCILANGKCVWETRKGEKLYAGIHFKDMKQNHIEMIRDYLLTKSTERV